MRGDRHNDRARKLILHREEIFELAVIPLRPAVCTGIGIDKACTDPNSLTRPAHAALQEVAHAESASNVPWFVDLATRVSGNYREIGASAKARDDLFCYAIRERGVRSISTKAGKGNNCNRRLVWEDDYRCGPSNFSTSDLVHICHEANASARERLDQTLLLAVVADRRPQRADSAV